MVDRENQVPAALRASCVPTEPFGEKTLNDPEVPGCLPRCYSQPSNVTFYSKIANRIRKENLAVPKEHGSAIEKLLALPAVLARENGFAQKRLSDIAKGYGNLSGKKPRDDSGPRRLRLTRTLASKSVARKKPPKQQKLNVSSINSSADRDEPGNNRSFVLSLDSERPRLPAISVRRRSNANVAGTMHEDHAGKRAGLAPKLRKRHGRNMAAAMLNKTAVPTANKRKGTSRTRENEVRFSRLNVKTGESVTLVPKLSEEDMLPLRFAVAQHSVFFAVPEPELEIFPSLFGK